MLKGYKTYLAAFLIAAGAVLDYLYPGSEYSKILYGIGAALGLYGLREKLERVDPGA